MCCWNQREKQMCTRTIVHGTMLQMQHQKFPLCFSVRALLFFSRISFHVNVVIADMKLIQIIRANIAIRCSATRLPSRAQRLACHNRNVAPIFGRVALFACVAFFLRCGEYTGGVQSIQFRISPNVKQKPLILVQTKMAQYTTLFFFFFCASLRIRVLSQIAWLCLRFRQSMCDTRTKQRTSHVSEWQMCRSLWFCSSCFVFLKYFIHFIKRDFHVVFFSLHFSLSMCQHQCQHQIHALVNKVN